MISGYVLIVSVLILGGVIATVGDYLGARVGKARLSLFNLRPRKTATLVNILTGSVVSAATLGILFAVSDQLRTGVFELQEIEEKLEQANQDLQEAEVEKDRIEAELDSSRSELRQVETEKQQAEAAKAEAEQERARVEDQLHQTRQQLKTVSKELRQFRAEIEALQAERQELIAQRDAVVAQIAERDEEIARKEQEIAEREQEIAERDRIIAQRETRLEELEEQQTFLEERVELLTQNYQVLRQGNVAIVRGQILASALVRVLEPSRALQAVDQLLQEANRTAVDLAQPSTGNFNQQLVQITEAEVEQLVQQIRDGEDYFVRIISASNYVLGESRVRVFADAAPNRVIFDAGDVIAATSLDRTTLMDIQKLNNRIEFLIEASKFRARSAGYLGETIQIGDGRIETLIRFIEALQQYGQPVEVKAVVAETTYTAGPFRIELVVIREEQVDSPEQETPEGKDTPEQETPAEQDASEEQEPGESD